MDNKESFNNSSITDSNDLELIDGFEGLISAKGTSKGLILSLDCRAPKDTILKVVNDFANRRKGFLRGGDIFIEYRGCSGDKAKDIKHSVKDLLANKYNIFVKESLNEESGLIEEENVAVCSNNLSRSPRNQSSINMADGFEQNEANLKSLSLFDGIGLVSDKESDVDVASSFADNSSSLGDVNLEGFKQDNIIHKGQKPLFGFNDYIEARVFYGTLRSGQRIESESSIVICGDVNNGAEIISGGDIFVLGKLRGIAHAGAFDESGGGRVVFALSLSPTQLRIGGIISRGSEDGGAFPEIARVEGNNIVVQKYDSRTSLIR